MAGDEVSTTDGPDRRQVTVGTDGQVLAAADVDSAGGPEIVQAVLHGEVTPLPGGVGRRLVDAVLDLPEVAVADRLSASIPGTDTEMVERLQERAADVRTRRAGGTVLADAQLRDADRTQPKRPAM